MHVRTHTHKLKPLNHFTVVPQPLSPLRFNNVPRRISASLNKGADSAGGGALAGLAAATAEGTGPARSGQSAGRGRMRGRKAGKGRTPRPQRQMARCRAAVI